MLRNPMRRLVALAAGLCLGVAALADTPVAATQPADTAWLLTATALVLFMTLPGLALFYAGLVRGKNALSILIQCFAISAVVSVLWVALGYGLVFGDGGAAQALIGGLGKAGLRGVLRDSTAGTVPESVFLMFQMTFAIITPALIIGGFAERIRFSVVLGFAALWLLLVYVPVAHWVWGGGWLARLGVMDFAGGIVVHVNAGVGALVCALVIGRRRGFPHVSMPPHNLPLTAAGAGMLWVGWPRLQRRQRARRQRLGRHGAAVHAPWRRGWRARVDGARVVAVQQALDPRHPHRRGGRPRHHRRPRRHRPVGGAGDQGARRNGLLRRHAVPQAAPSTIRSTCRRCTASAASSARCCGVFAAGAFGGAGYLRCRMACSRRSGCRRSASW
ncbi:MAG: hypothetical protein U1F06_02000 [Steroidobacteraceae bacterium]